MQLSWCYLLIACFVSLASAMFFDLVDQREKCIIEEIPEDVLVTGYFFVEHWDLKKQDNSPHLGVTVTVRDPNNEVLLMKRFARYGKFTFTSHASGQHFLCMKSNSTRFSVFAGERLVSLLSSVLDDPGHSELVKNWAFSWTCKETSTDVQNWLITGQFGIVKKKKVHLDVQMGEHTIDPSTEKAKETFKTMEYRMQHLIDQMQYISKQQDFQREREELFREMSETTNASVLWWALLQTSVLLTVGFWQMRNLKNFLIEKKLV